MNQLSLEEKATNYDTFRHIERVRNLINLFIKELLVRGEKHDQSKMEKPEVEYFTKYTEKLAGCTYGSDEYNQFKRELAPALTHHYSIYPHHPEHFKLGILDMNLIDLLEMFVDWKASSERHNDGNILKSIEINGERFNMGATLVKIFENTAKMIGD